MSTKTSVNGKGGSVARRFQQMASAHFGFNDFYGDDAQSLDMDKLYTEARKKIGQRKPDAHILLFMENKFRCAAYKILLEQQGFKVTHCFYSRNVFSKHLRDASVAYDAVLVDWESDDVRGRDIVHFYNQAFPQFPLLFIALVSDNYPPSMAIRGGADLFLRLPLIIHVPVLKQLLLPQTSLSVKFPSHTLAAAPSYKKIVDTLSHMSQYNTRRNMDEVNIIASDVRKRLSEEDIGFLTEQEAAVLMKNVAKLVAPTGKFKVHAKEEEGAGGGGDEEEEGSGTGGGAEASSSSAFFESNNKKDIAEFEERVQKLVSKKKKLIKYSVDFQFLQDIVGAAKMMKNKFDEVQAENKVLRRFTRKILDITPRPKHKVKDDNNNNYSDDDKNGDQNEESDDDDSDVDESTKQERRAMKELKRDQALKTWLKKSGAASSSAAGDSSVQLPVSVLAAISKYSTETVPVAEVTAHDVDLVPKSKLLENALKLQDRLFQAEAELARTSMAFRSSKTLDGAIRSAVKKMTTFRDGGNNNSNNNNNEVDSMKIISKSNKHSSNPTNKTSHHYTSSPRYTSPSNTPQSKALSPKTGGSLTPRTKILDSKSNRKQRKRGHRRHDSFDSFSNSSDDNNDDDSSSTDSSVGTSDLNPSDLDNNESYENFEDIEAKVRRKKELKEKLKQERKLEKANRRTLNEILEERLMFQEDTASRNLQRSGAIEPVVFRHRWQQDRPLVNPAFVRGFDEMAAIMNKVCVILNDLSIRVSTLYPPCQSRFVDCATAFKGIVDDVRWEHRLNFSSDDDTLGQSLNPSSPMLKRGLSFMKKVGGKDGNNNKNNSLMNKDDLKMNLEIAHKLRVAKVRGTRLARAFAEKQTVRRVIDVWHAWVMLRRQQRLFDEEKNDMKRMQYILSNVKLEKAEKEKLIQELLKKAQKRDELFYHNRRPAEVFPDVGGKKKKKENNENNNHNDGDQQKDDDNEEETDEFIKSMGRGAVISFANVQNSGAGVFGSSSSSGAAVPNRKRRDSTVELLEMIQNHENDDDFVSPLSRALNQANAALNQYDEQQQQRQQKKMSFLDQHADNTEGNDEAQIEDSLQFDSKTGKVLGHKNSNNKKSSSSTATNYTSNTASSANKNAKMMMMSAASASQMNINVPQVADVRVLPRNSHTSSSNKKHEAGSSTSFDNSNYQEYGIFDASVAKSTTDPRAVGLDDSNNIHHNSSNNNQSRRGSSVSPSALLKAKKFSPRRGEFGTEVKGGSWGKSEGHATSPNPPSAAMMASSSARSPRGVNFGGSSSRNSNNNEKKRALSKEEQERLIARLTGSMIGGNIKSSSSSSKNYYNNNANHQEQSTVNNDDDQVHHLHEGDNTSITDGNENHEIINNVSKDNNNHQDHQLHHHSRPGVVSSPKRLVSFTTDTNNISTSSHPMTSNNNSTTNLHTVSLGASFIGGNSSNTTNHPMPQQRRISPTSSSVTAETVNHHHEVVQKASPPLSSSSSSSPHHNPHQKTAVVVQPSLSSVPAKPRPVLSFDGLMGNSIMQKSSSSIPTNYAESARVAGNSHSPRNNNSSLSMSMMKLRQHQQPKFHQSFSARLQQHQQQQQQQQQESSSPNAFLPPISSSSPLSVTKASSPSKN